MTWVGGEVRDGDNGRLAGGMFWGLTAYVWWGLMPLFFKRLDGASVAEQVAQRVVWSVAAMSLLLTYLGYWGRVAACLRSRRTFTLLACSTAVILVNWCVFLYGVWSGQVVDTALGYFITPLLSAGMGIALFGERLRSLQWLALGVAVVGVAVQLVGLGRLPWISLTLAVSFGLYGMVRKRAGVDGMTGLTVEAGLVAPFALGFLLVKGFRAQLAFFGGSETLSVMLILSGPMTAVPLVCFSQAVVRLRLTTIGFLQYLAPTLSLLLAVFVMGEPFGVVKAWSFGLIWAAIAVFLYDAFRAADRPRRREVPDASVDSPVPAHAAAE